MRKLPIIRHETNRVFQKVFEIFCLPLSEIGQLSLHIYYFPDNQGCGSGSGSGVFCMDPDPVFKFSGSGSGSGFSQDSGKLQKGL